MSLSRRKFFPAAAGAAAAVTQVPAALQDVAQAVTRARDIPPGVALGNMPATAPMESNTPHGGVLWDMMQDRDKYARWARGDFTEDELNSHDSSRKAGLDSMQSCIDSLKSVSPSQKLRMQADLRLRREIETAKLHAKYHLAEIMQRFEQYQKGYGLSMTELMRIGQNWWNQRNPV